MKGEFDDGKDVHSAIFQTLHQAQEKFNPLHHPFHHSPAATHHFQLSEESDSAAVATPSTGKKEHDGATIEVVRRPRGRPPGSKNKPKPPVIITRDAEPSMSPYVLELPRGSDVVESVTQYCKKRNTGLCILTGSGTVANVTLRQPTTTPASTVTFHGRFDILSISATILSPSPQSLATSPFCNAFTISLAGPQGQIVGGSVVGPLIAAGTVYVIAATFNNPLYHRLPIEDDTGRNSGSVSGRGGQSPPAVSGGGDSGQPSTTAAGESRGMSIYSCHLPSDVIWGPSGRQLPPPPPPY